MADPAAKWNFLLTLLYNQIQGDAPKSTLESTRERLRRFALEIDQSITPLSKPDFNDPCFKGLRFGFPKDTREKILNEAKRRGRPKEGDRASYLDHVRIPVTADPVQLGRVIMELERLYINSKQRSKEYGNALRAAKARRGRMLEAQESGKAFLPYSSNLKKDDPGPCWCACGKAVNFRLNVDGRKVGIYRFRRGHILKYIKLVSLVEAGFVRWEDLPILLKEGFKWVACKKCRGPIPAVDPFGRALKPDEQIGIVCWRERMGVRWPYHAPKKLPKASYSTPARLRSNYADGDAR